MTTYIVKFVSFLILVFLLPSCAIMTPSVEKKMNPVTFKGPYQIPDNIKTLHSRLFIADLHADSLLWSRNLLKLKNYGHSDLPRALEANLALQVFGVVTKTPKKQNFSSNSADTDQIKTLTIMQCWPTRTWNSLLERALYQSEKLADMAENSEGRLMIIKTLDDLETLIRLKQSGQSAMGGFCGLEGTHALEGNIENLDVLYNAGFRMLGLHHFFDNKAGGSAHGIEKGGLTPFGKALVEKAQSKGMVIDLAHSSPKVMDDVLSMSKAPVVVSHTGVRGTCDNQRNLSDDQIRGIASTGGVIGIGLFGKVVCGNSVEDAARAMRYATDLVGVDYVALGSDFDGAVETSVDVRGLPLLTQALVNEGFTETDIQKLMGANVIRVLRQVLK